MSIKDLFRKNMRLHMIPSESIELLQDLTNRYTRLKKTANTTKTKEEVLFLEKKMNQDSFWNNPKKAQEVSQKAVQLKKQLNTWNTIREHLEYLTELTQIDISDTDAKEVVSDITKLEKQFLELETQTLLSEEYDSSNAIVTLLVGNGGQDAEDFTNILYRMYLRYCDNKSFSVQILDESLTDDGLKSATLHIKGIDAYGMLKAEHGVHRLIRQSPFNSKGLRQTSFSRVEIIPEIQQDKEVHIEDKDLRIDVFRASGNGGQSVNTTDSAVRITYLPLGISVSCQNEKSQLQNKQTALKILTSRLLQLQSEQQTQEIKEIRGDVMENSFGSQIRTYTLHPYKMVKDHRTNREENNPQKVFDGALDDFIFDYLQYASQK